MMSCVVGKKRVSECSMDRYRERNNARASARASPTPAWLAIVFNLWLRSNRSISSSCCALALTWRPRKKENWFERCSNGRKLLDNLKNDIIETKLLIRKCEKKVVVKNRRFGHMTVLQCKRKLLNYAIQRFSLTLKTSCYTANFGIDPYSWMIIIIRRRRRRRRKEKEIAITIDDRGDGI